VIAAMRRHLRFSFLIISTLWLARPALSQTEDSTRQVTLKSQPRSLKWTEADERAFLAKALQGDAHSQFWLACSYEQGWLGKPNFPAAFKWFKRSADLGDPDAQNSLGKMYEDGEGVARNYVSAANWYRKAAEHVPDFGGTGQGRNNLGLLYMDGHGVPRDYVRAYMWFCLDGRTNPNLIIAKGRMTPEQRLEAERLVAEWKSRRASQ
jgi:uncharacterized protein